MSTSNASVRSLSPHPAEAPAPSRWEKQLPTLLSVIAGMVDLTGFLTLGNIFTAHITGNLVIIAAVLVRVQRLNPAQALAIPAFMLALAAMWLLASVSGRRGSSLARLFLLIQLLLLFGLLIFSVVTRPSANPHGSMAAVAVMIAVAAMACQYALFRLALPGAVSTASMTGNLTNTVLLLMDTLSRGQLLIEDSPERLRTSLHLLFGFLAGCAAGGVAVSLVRDWAWAFPVALAGGAVALERS